MFDFQGYFILKVIHVVKDYKNHLLHVYHIFNDTKIIKKN